MDQNSFDSQGSGDNYSGDDVFKNLNRQGTERRTAVVSRGAAKKDAGSLE